MAGLLDVPDNAVWPRLMTVPHPDAVDSLLPEFEQWVHDRDGVRLRWWQRLVAARVLEVDADERLCWEAVVLTLARQLGKSLLLRELAMWRIHQHDRFGEPQDVLHTGKDLAVCKEVQRPARIWAKACCVPIAAPNWRRRWTIGRRWRCTSIGPGRGVAG